jgi:hypothetical protein
VDRDYKASKWKRAKSAAVRAYFPDYETANDPQRQAVWVGKDPDCWISATHMSATRVVKKYIPDTTVSEQVLVAEFIDEPEGGGDAALAPGMRGRGRGGKRLTTMQTKTKGVAVIFWGVSTSKCTTKTEQDFFDFNGDRYPDTVKRGKVKFSRPDGSLGQTRDVNYRHVRENTSKNSATTTASPAGPRA